ncbi:alanine/glycine:cation symporter family protein [uncultured Oscillibacter sp.]|uniref:alanine/glycine:cation symporter family protein n=1 Tax=uncultured Oscillibacter sp. TaxID=876091 RepID=UPI00280B3780|nr:alanine/glycine:cation symporter family protein [uncultured Oscillibacter sp.]
MLSEMIGVLNNWLYTYILVILLIAAGVYFTVRSGFVQFRMFAESIRVVGEKPHEAGTVSSFQALMVSTASRVGTGNIIGISTAICCGGYGAVFWMWVIAIIGGASAFVESTLAQIYKRRNPKTGESYGGPSYYIEAALHSRVLAVIFAVTLILTYAGGFNMLAAYNLQSTFSGYSFYDPATTPWVIGAVLAAVVGYCVMGGGKRIIRFTSTLVPFMGGLYVLVAVVMVVLNWRMVPQVLGSIFAGAFDFQAIFGGFTGSAMMYGIKRGLFSNEAGVGSAPNAAASADVSHPVKQGLVQMLSVFIDTLLICSATAFMLLCSGVAPEASLQGAPYVQMALQAQLGAAGPIFITAAMVLFAFTTLIGNLYYVDNCLNYIVGKIPAKEFMVLFRIDAVVLIFIGAGMEINMVWNLADVLMGVMALINLPVIVILAKPALAALRDYTRQRKEGKNPVFRAADVGLAGKTECWE